MYDNTRSPEKHWCVSAGEPLRPLSLVTRWVTYVHSRNVSMWSSWDLCLSPQYQVTLFFYFFLIKSQQRCYLTLIWSQLNPCLNLWCCEAHSNLLSIQPLKGTTRKTHFVSVCVRSFKYLECLPTYKLWNKVSLCKLPQTQNIGFNQPFRIGSPSYVTHRLIIIFAPTSTSGYLYTTTWELP